jgi:O-antigen/teichoic acid export membrane protein
MKSQAFLRHAAVYGLANVLVPAAGFLLLPLYTRRLSKADFAALEIVVRIAETASTLLLFGGLRQALLTFYRQGEDDEARRRTAGSALSLVAVAALVGGAVVFPLCGPLSSWLDGEGRGLTPGLIRLAVLAILLEPFTLLPLALLQARLQSTSFVAVTVSQFVFRVTLTVVFVAAFGWGARGVLGATALTGLLFGSVLTAVELARGASWPDGATVRGFLAFSLPFIPSAVCFFVMQHGDRFFLWGSWGEEEVGTYALGYKLALTVNTFSLAPLYMVWSAHMYDVARRPDAPTVFGRAFTRILAVVVFMGLGIALFQDEAIAVLGGSAYAGAAAVVAPVLLACVFQAAASLMDAGFYVRRRTGLKLYTTFAATALMLALYSWLIPRYAGMGAALATLGGYVFLAAGTLMVTQRVFFVRYEWLRLGGMLSLAVALWLVSRLLPAAAWTIAAKAGLWLSWPLALWFGRLVSGEEKEQLLTLGRAACRLLRTRGNRGAAPAVAAPSGTMQTAA